MTLDDIKKIVSGLNISFRHIKDAKLLKKLKGGDLVEIFRITMTTIFTPENIEAITKGATTAYLESKKHDNRP